MSDYMSRIRQTHTQIQNDRATGESALRRLLPIAQSDTGQSKKVAQILLGLYNGHRFPVDLTNLRSLDYAVMEDVLAVMRMDANALQEVHLYFQNGSAVFEKLAADWGFENKTKARGVR